MRSASLGDLVPVFLFAPLLQRSDPAPLTCRWPKLRSHISLTCESLAAHMCGGTRAPHEQRADGTRRWIRCKRGDCEESRSISNLRASVQIGPLGGNTSR